MKAVLDTNVLISGIFFGGVPRQILDAWEGGRFELVLIPDDLRRVPENLRPTLTGTSGPLLRGSARYDRGPR